MWRASRITPTSTLKHKLAYLRAGTLPAQTGSLHDKWYVNFYPGLPGKTSLEKLLRLNASKPLLVGFLQCISLAVGISAICILTMSMTAQNKVDIHNSSLQGDWPPQRRLQRWLKEGCSGVVRFVAMVMIFGLMMGVMPEAIALNLLPAPAEEPGTTPIETISWSSTANRYRDRLGEEVSFFCPPNGVENRIWGSDVYADQSSICTAAVHAGLITLDAGGAIAIHIHPGQDSYPGSTQNEVASGDLGPWPGSFTFTTLRDAVAGVMITSDGTPIALQIAAWETTAEAFASQVNQVFAVYCPGNGTGANVWGSDIYRDASSICTAGVHAGKITTQTGGAIAFKMVAPMPFYIGNTRHGITSRHWQGGRSSFQFLPE
jgi:hypothetical protein